MIINDKIIIDRANKVHDSLYTYLNIFKKNKKSYIEIICEKHGLFIQRVDCHLRGDKCSKCFNEKRTSNINNFIR